MRQEQKRSHRVYNNFHANSAPSFTSAPVPIGLGASPAAPARGPPSRASRPGPSRARPCASPAPSDPRRCTGAVRRSRSVPRDHKADPLASSLVRKSFVVLAAFACFGSCSQSCPTVENAQPRAVWHAEHDFGAHELIIHSIKIICGIEMQGRVKIESVLSGQARGPWAGTTVRARGFRGQRTLCR